MNSRDKILEQVKKNQPEMRELPALPLANAAATDHSPAFVSMVESIGGHVYTVSGYERIATILQERFGNVRRVVTACPQLAGFAETGSRYDDPHTLENVELAVIPAYFGVAENGACWVTEMQLVERALPFIAQHLALVVRKEAIVGDMHAAYERIALLEAAGGAYGFATFIAGPSKTADIEQSLVLGAHGPVSLTVFLVDEGLSDQGFY
jgi:L-lactate dehydrogenase complex protein LldG